MEAAQEAHAKAKAECDRSYPGGGDPNFNCLLAFDDTPEGRIYKEHAMETARAYLLAHPLETSVNNPKQNFLVGCDYGYTLSDTGAVHCNSKPVDVRIVP